MEQFNVFPSKAVSSDPDRAFVFDQSVSGSIWCSTLAGQLTRFPKEVFQSAFAIITSRQSTSESSKLSPDRLLTPRQPLSFRISLLKISPSERLAIFVGYSEHRPVLVVATLDAKPLSFGQNETYNFICSQGDFIFGRKGKIIQQTSWFPGEDSSYFAVLSGNCFAIYNAHSLGVPYATYRLHVTSTDPPSLKITRGMTIAFSFFESSIDWKAFAVCFLRDDGSIFILCPVVIPGMHFQKSDALKLISGGNMTDKMLNWHHAVFSRTLLRAQDAGSKNERTDSQIATRCIDASWDFIPALQGPINVDCDDHGDDFCSVLVSKDLQNLLTATTSGLILVHSIDQVMPVFQEGNPVVGPPHLLRQVDCFQTKPFGSSRLVQHVKLSQSGKNSLILKGTEDASTVVVVSDTFSAAIWFPLFTDKSQEPFILISELSKVEIGCGISGVCLFSIQCLDNLQIKCRILDGRSTFLNVKSQIPSVTELINDLDESQGGLEEISYDKVVSLRDKFQTAKSILEDVCNHQEGITIEMASEIDKMCSQLDLFWTNATDENAKMSLSRLSDQYKSLLAKLALSESFVEFQEDSK